MTVAWAKVRSSWVPIIFWVSHVAARGAGMVYGTLAFPEWVVGLYRHNLKTSYQHIKTMTLMNRILL